jgi:transcriptional regulator with XRE-family HTH domain
MKYRHIDFIFNHIKFATDIRGAMLENKLTGEELAEISGVSPATISACASNNNPKPHIGTILAIANALELNAMNYIELAY